jgi:hypothetical protein
MILMLTEAQLVMLNQFLTKIDEIPQEVFAFFFFGILFPRQVH